MNEVHLELGGLSMLVVVKTYKLSLVDGDLPMIGTKPWYASKTIWFGIVQTLLGIAIVAGFITPMQSADALMKIPDAILGAIVTILGSGGIWGRTVATKEISSAGP